MLTATRLEQFQEEGYLVVDDVLDLEKDLQPVVDEYTALLDELAEWWHRDGKLSSSYQGLPFGHRLTKILNESGQAYYSYFDISLPQAGVTEDTPIHLGPAVFNLLTSPRLLDLVEEFVGPEIYSNPIQHVRIKPPESLVPEQHRNSLTAQTDWHQDQGVHLPEADNTDILTVWLPITDATEENGCLCVVPRSQRGGLVTHCTGKPGSGKGLHIPDELLGPKVVPAPIKRGGVLLLNRRTMHASLRNVSDDIRWSFDLRYQPAGLPTGRPAFPGFVARSRLHPESAVTDWRAWADLWRATKQRMIEADAGKFNRWTGQEPVCA